MTTFLGSPILRKLIEFPKQKIAFCLHSLLGQVLERFQVEIGGKLLVATLCLLECSRHGLLESELLQLLADEDNLFPPEYANKFHDDKLDDYEITGLKEIKFQLVLD